MRGSRRQHARESLLAVLVIGVLLLAGCSSRLPGLSSDPAGDSGGGAPRGDRGGVSGSISGYPASLTPEQATMQSEAVVLGTVVEVLPASWSTADRKSPALSRGEGPIGELIYTPVRVRVDKRYKGRVGEFLVVKYFGGAIDEETVMVADSFGEIPAPGDRVAVFVDYTFREKNGDILAVPADIYDIANGKARRQSGQKVEFPLADFEKKVEASAQ